MQTRRHFLAGAAAGAALMLHESQAEEPSKDGKLRLLIGTIHDGKQGDKASSGIYAAHFDNGTLSAPVLAAAVPSPGFLTIAPGAPSLLFACTGPESGQGEAASFALARSPETQGMRAISHASTGDVGGCYVGASRDGRCVFVANYSGGSVTSFRADAAGNLKQASLIRFPSDEHGPVASRQEKSHVHCAIQSPDGEYVLVNDLGLDRVHVFRLNHATAELMPHTPSHWASAPGAGPRHLRVHPNGKWIYCLNEVNNTVDQLLWDAKAGTLRTLSTVSTLPTDVPTTGAHACELVFSKDMRFLYASNRTFEGFAVFSVDAATGALKPVQHLANPGKESRDLAIDPTGKWLLSANQFSGDVSVFPIDVATGRLGERAGFVALAGASCLLFA